LPPSKCELTFFKADCVDCLSSATSSVPLESRISNHPFLLHKQVQQLKVSMQSSMWSLITTERDSQ